MAYHVFYLSDLQFIVHVMYCRELFRFFYLSACTVYSNVILKPFYVDINDVFFLDNWCREIKTWCPSMDFSMYYGELTCVLWDKLLRYRYPRNVQPRDPIYTFRFNGVCCIEILSILYFALTGTIFSTGVFISSRYSYCAVRDPWMTGTVKCTREI